MKTFKARGVVLREYEAGEADKRLILLCKGIGKLNVYVRGARKPKSKFMAAAQLFTYGDFVLSDGGAFRSVAQAEVIESFYALRADYGRLSAAHYISEICDRTVLEDTPSDDLLLLLLRSLSHLNKTDVPARQISLVFLFRFFACYGVAPETERCGACGGAVPGPSAAVPFGGEGVCCAACAGGKARKTHLSPAGLAALRHILNAPPAGAFRFTASDAALGELGRAGKLFWDSHFQLNLKSEAFLGG